MIERVHAKLVKKLPPSCAAGLCFTLTEHRHSNFSTYKRLFSIIFNIFFSILKI